MANEITLGFTSGLTLKYAVSQPDGTERVALTALPEIGTTGYYVASDANVVAGDFVVIRKTPYAARDVIAQGQYQPITDSVENIHNWYVAKTGLDANTGHSFAKAKLTVQAAINAAANGDTIIVYPGTYDSASGFDSSAKFINIIGVDKYNCVIMDSSGVEAALKFGSKGSVENISCVGAQGVQAAGRTELNLINSYFEGFGTSGTIDGAFLSGARRVFIDKCYFKSTYDAIQCYNCTGIIQNSVIESVGGSSNINRAVTSRGLITPYANLIFDNCLIMSERSDTVAFDAIGVDVSGYTMNINNSSIRASVGANCTGSSIAVRVVSGGICVLNNCVLKSSKVNVASTAYDIVVEAGGILRLNNCQYEPTKVSNAGTIEINEVDVTQIAGATVNTALAQLGVNTITVIDKTGYKLASDGLDSISTTEPTGKASTFREMVIQIWRRLFGKTTLTSSQLTTYKTDGTTVATTQTVSETSTLQTQGESV